MISYAVMNKEFSTITRELKEYVGLVPLHNTEIALFVLSIIKENGIFTKYVTYVSNENL